MKKLISLLIISILSLSNLKAQTSEITKSSPTNFYNDFVKPANFIFEATSNQVEVVTENKKHYVKIQLKVHKVFKGNLPSYNLTYKSEIDSGGKAYFLKYKDESKKFNNYDGTGNTAMYFFHTLNNGVSSSEKITICSKDLIEGIGYFLNFDTYTYKDKEMLVKNVLKYGNNLRDTTEVGMPYGYKDLVKVKDLYDTLLRFPDIKLSYDDGSIFRQVTAKEWLDAHPGMRPNWKNIAEPIPPVQINKPTDPELLKQNAEDFKKAIEFRKKMSKPLSPKEKRKLKKQQRNNNATMSYFIKN